MALVDLPVGASFEPASGLLSWRPDFFAGNDPKDPSADFRTYSIRVLLSSSSEPQSVVDKVIAVQVRNTPRPVEMSWNVRQFKMTEGKPFSASVEIKSQDFPKGPFQFFLSGLPSGVDIRKSAGAPNAFTVGYTPGLNVVTKSDEFSGGAFSKTWQVEAVVIDPAGNKTVTPFDWKVMDFRMDPVVSAPSALQQLDDIRLQAVSMDPNLEAAPEVSVVQPKFGTLSVENEKDEAFTTRSTIRWYNIPADQLGKIASLDIKSCVFGSSTQQNRCFTKQVMVKFEAAPLSEPSIDRTRWPLGQVRYIREGGSFKVRLPVKNPNSADAGVSVTIEPDTIRAEVQYQAGELVITPKTSGFRQFNVSVRIPQGLARTESFSFEALPKNWSRVLVLGDGLRDPEVAGTLALIPGAQVVNPLMQELSDRTLALRDAVIIGTSLLSDPAAIAAAVPAVEQIKVVMIQSPRLDLVGSSFWSQLGALGVSLQGRLSAVIGSNVPGLDKLPIKPAQNSGLAAPSSPLFLAGKLTTESTNPSLLSVSAGTCQPLLNMSYKPVSSLPPYDLTFAVKCEERGKRWIISGAEWADLLPQSGLDRAVVASWMKEVLK
ncbi:hypothetical protein EBZ37_04925 [bacterium]|nr:hypothetical protein [bacterium]